MVTIEQKYQYLPKELVPDLLWRHNNSLKAYNDLKNDIFDLQICTGASLSGCGAVCQGDSNLKGAKILIRTDNTTALTYLNKMGSVRFPHLNKLARQIWQWGETKNLCFFATYICSGESVYFGPSTNLLLCPYRGIRHPMSKTIILAAAKLCGKHSNRKEFPRRQLTQC
ncbi:hypothetical protein NQ315_013458 [Exocentrus adspersus]|uniref:Uncharacterized protein n=1 Tax=Exocentrus adspersus TaxID=1586481 RepID=A0AAV8VDW2_9CUCU|nr:hypothetical protein NQ315_013458 [Exocentrus adspersus]